MGASSWVPGNRLDSVTESVPEDYCRPLLLLRSMAPTLEYEDAMRPFIDVDPDSEPSRQSYIKFVEGKSPEEVRWWSKDTVAVVTGANKGIGFEIVRQLASVGITTILTARDESRGLAAVNALKAQGLENVCFHLLEVNNSASAAKLTSWIKEKYGGIDILVCNAGVGGGGSDPDYESAKFILDTNYDGQKIVTSALLPLLRPSAAGARVIFVSSELGELKHLQSEKLRQILNDGDNLTEDKVDALRSTYLEDVKGGKDSEWSTGFARQYVVSKVLLNAYSRVLAKSLASRPSGSKVYVNSMTPGLTTTDMCGNLPQIRTVHHGADTAVWLALFPSGGPNGGFFRDRADFPF